MIFWMLPAVFTPIFHLPARISTSDIPAASFITDLDVTVGNFSCVSVLEFVDPNMVILHFFPVVQDGCETDRGEIRMCIDTEAGVGATNYLWQNQSRPF